MVSHSIGSRSLSKMLQGAQFEAALIQIAQKAGILNLGPNGDPLSQQYMQNNFPYLQQVTLSGNQINM